MDKSDRPHAMAQWMWDARQRRAPYQNLPEELRPGSAPVEAYAGKADYRLAEPLYGAVGLRQDRHHDESDATADGHHASLRGRDLHEHDPQVSGAVANCRFRQPAPGKRDCPAARRRFAGVARAMDARFRRACGRRRDARVRTHRGPQRRLCSLPSALAHCRELLEWRRRHRRTQSRVGRQPRRHCRPSRR